MRVASSEFTNSLFATLTHGRKGTQTFFVCSRFQSVFLSIRGFYSPLATFQKER